MTGISGRRIGVMLTVFCLFLMLSTPSSIQLSTAAEDDIPLGTETWKLPEFHRIYVQEIPSETDPGELETGFVRDYPSSAEPTGSTRFGAMTNMPSGGTVFEVYSPPATETMNITANITVEFFVSLTFGGSIISAGCGGWGTTSFDVEVGLAGTAILSETVDISVLRHSSVEKYSTGTVEANLLITEDDQFSLRIDVIHNCPDTQGALWWGGIESTTGLIIDGDLLQPELTVRVDDNRIPHIRFVPYSPWGISDYDMTRFDLFIWGPVDTDVVDTNSEDQFVEHFSHPDGNTTVEGNRTGLTWVGSVQVKPGHHLLKSCIRTVDMSDWDTSSVSQCPDSSRMAGVGVSFVQSSYRFGVDSDGGGGISAFSALATIWFISLFAQIVMALRGSGVLPWPVMVLMLLLTLSALPWASNLSPVGETFEREDGPMPNFVLLDHGGGSVSLSELLDEGDALVLGVFQSDSPNAYQQYEQLKLLEEAHPEVAIAQLATGDELRALDLDAYSEILNESWPLLLDEASSAVAKQLPTGSGDAVIIIDSSGTVTWSEPGVAGVDELSDNIEVIQLGSQQSMGALIALFWIASWPLLFFAFPMTANPGQEEDEVELLIPGSIWLGTLLGAGAGAALVSLPIVILALTPLVPGAWWAIEVGMALWMVWHGVSLVLFKTIPEVAFLTKLLHGRLPEIYTSRRDLQATTRDVHLGIWIGWIAWSLMPMFFVQGIADILLDGFTGILLGSFYWLAALVLLGAIVLSHRVLAAGFGRLGAIFGTIADDQLVRSVGVIIISVAICLLITAAMHLIATGVSFG